MAFASHFHYLRNLDASILVSHLSRFSQQKKSRHFRLQLLIDFFVLKVGRLSHMGNIEICLPKRQHLHTTTTRTKTIRPFIIDSQGVNNPTSQEKSSLKKSTKPNKTRKKNNNLPLKNLKKTQIVKKIGWSLLKRKGGFV